MGVDLMQFFINTARSRFLRLALETFDGNLIYTETAAHLPFASAAPGPSSHFLLRVLVAVCTCRRFCRQASASTSRCILSTTLTTKAVKSWSASLPCLLVFLLHFLPLLSAARFFRPCAGADALIQICEAYRVLRPGGIAFFGMINRDEGTFLGPYFRNESWWPSVAHRCGFESVVTTSNFTEWRAGPARYFEFCCF